MAGIQFNTIPGSGLVAPIFTAEFNSGGQYTSVDRIVLVGLKGTGVMSTDALTPVSSLQQAEYYCGQHSMLREMARVAFLNAPTAPIYLLATPSTGLTTEIRTITVGGTLSAGVGILEIQGERVQIAISSTDTTTTVAAALAAAINTYYNGVTGAVMPFTATSVGAVVTVTSTYQGIVGSEIDIYVPKDINNVLAGVGVITVAVTTAGTGAPASLATTLSVLGDGPADFVICPWSDSTSTGTYAAWSNDISGRWAWSRQSYGHVWCAALANYAGLLSLGGALNDRHLTVMGCVSPGLRGTPHPSFMWVTAAATRLFYWLTDVSTGNIGRSHKGLDLIGIKPPRDSAQVPNFNAKNTLLQSGISTFEVDAYGTVRINKIITTYQSGLSGQPDAVFRDIQSVYQCAEGMKYIRARLADLFGQKALVKVNPASLAAAVTPGEIKAGLVAIYGELCAALVFQEADVFAKLVVVQINSGNPNRVDVFLPLERVNPLDILAMNATIYQTFPNVNLASAA